MNFQDVIDKNNEQKKLLSKLQDFIQSIHNAKSKIEEMYDLLCKNSITNSMNGIQNTTINYCVVIRNLLIEIDGYELGRNIDKMKAIYSNEVINNLLDDIEKKYLIINKIKNIVSTDKLATEYINCLQNLYFIIEDYNSLLIIFEYTNTVSADLSQGISEAPLQIRSYNEILTETSFDNIVNPIKIIYEQLCLIANINTEEYPLNIIRVESGSITINFNGNKEICNIIEKIIGKLYKLFIRKFTKQGTRMNIAENLDVIKQELDIIKTMQEMGIDTTGINEIAKENLGHIVKQTTVFFNANPDFKINDKVIKRSEDVKALVNGTIFLTEDNVESQE